MSDTSQSPRRLAVIGHPVAHSRSPELHAHFATQTGIAIEYEKIDCEPGDFIDTVNRLRESGYAGVNVTVPFKAEAVAAADTCDAAAELAQAVNTLVFGDDGVAGYNTDGVGALRDMTARCGIDVAGKTVVVIGAGGAARGLMKPLLDAGPAVVVVAGRSPYNAEVIAEHFGAHGSVQAATYLALKGWTADVLIHASPAGHAGAMPRLPATLLAGRTVCYDLSYGQAHTVFRDWALARGERPVFDGLGMLVEQGAESFRLWTGQQPETESVVAAMRHGE